MRVQLTVNRVVERDGEGIGVELAGAVVDCDERESLQLLRDGLAREASTSTKKARSTSKSEDNEQEE